jgi:hypothetical protein
MSIALKADLCLASFYFRRKRQFLLALATTKAQNPLMFYLFPCYKMQ